MNQIFIFMLSYALVLIIGFILIQFLSNGFFSIFLGVKASRGKKVLVKIVDVQDNYYKKGEVNEGYLIVLDRLKQPHRIILTKAGIYRSIGVDCVDVDLKTNSVIVPNGTMVEGFDAVKTDHLYVRALERPVIKKTGDQIKVVLALLLIIGVSGLAAFFAFQNNEAILALQESINGLKAAGIIQ